MNTKDLARMIESFAPLALQEEWDNSGYSVDLGTSKIHKVLLCLDCTAQIVQEAKERQCEVIISHHPLLFRAVKRVDASGFPGSVVTKLVQAGISLYCAHTTMDSSPAGINSYVAGMLGIRNPAPLVPAAPAGMYKIAVTVPGSHVKSVRDALFDAGAGTLGSYCDCSFSIPGEGTFRAMPGASPFIGSEGSFEEVDEVMLQVLVPAHAKNAALDAVRRTHPYEMPAADLYRVEALHDSRAGLGAAGDLEKPVPLGEFAQHVRNTLVCPEVRFSGDPKKEVRRAAVCTGAGSDLVREALGAGADVLVTGEVKHNVFVEDEIPLIEAGHYDTEKWFVDAMRQALQKCGLNIQYKVDICVSRDMQRPYYVI